MLTVAPDQRSLIPRLCRQFSQATGWQLRFRPPGGASELVDIGDDSVDDLCCWSQEITDGVETTGHLRLDPPDRGQPETPFVLATDLAEGLAELLGTMAAMTRRLEMRSRDVSSLAEVGKSVPPQDNVAWALGRLLKAVVRLTNSQSAAFFLLTPDTNRLNLRAVQHIAPTAIPHPIRDVMSNIPDLRALAHHPDRIVNERDDHNQWLPAGCRAGLCVAVQSDNTPIGTLWLFDQRAHVYSQREEQVASVIATQIAGILERATLPQMTAPHKDETWKRIERDVRIAAEGQSQLTPTTLPVDPRIEIAARCENCFELGGDLCELFTLDPDRLAIAIGDASGNSVPAAMIMAAVRGALRTHPANETDIQMLLKRMNGMLCEITRSHQFMSLFHGVLNLRERRLTYGNAGHPNPLLIRNGLVVPLNSHGMLLGIIRESPYETETVNLLPGDFLILYSDGISEVRDSSRQMFGAEGIISAVNRLRSQTVETVLQGIWSAAESHTDPASPPDDRTVMVLRLQDHH